MSRERRVHPRMKASIPARLTSGGDSLEGVIENIGVGGVFFATETLEVVIDEGASVVLHFELPGEGGATPHQVDANVLRTERYFDGTRVVRAFAIKFDDQLALDADSLVSV